MAFMEILLLVAATLAAIYYWSKRNNEYWRRNNIPYIEATPLLGNIKNILTMKSCFGLFLSDVYNEPRMAEEPVVGLCILNKPALVIREPELIKSILIKDFNKFSNRYSACDPHGDPLGANNLFFVKNPLWKDTRTKISPVFTSGKIKQMYPLMLEIAAELENCLARMTNNKEGTYSTEVKEICALFTTDNIATIAYGVRANSLQNPNGEFRRQGRKIFDFTVLRAFDFFVAFFLPEWAAFFRIKVFSKEGTKFLRESINYVLKERERSGSIRNDLIDILLSLKREAAADASGKHVARDSDFLVAQAGVFFTAGFETSSSTMAFALYELAKQPELQKRLRAEICDAFVAENGIISYDKINNLEYLGMVLDEVLRLYPVLPFLDREYLPTNEEQFTLQPYYDYKLQRNMPIYIPIYGIQRDPKYWPNPNNFDPERFSPENRKQHNPMTYLPFGTGPHNCIGNRFGLLQAKIGLAHFFKNHHIATCEQTVPKMSFDPKAMILQSNGGIYLKIVHDNLYTNTVSNK